MVNLCQRRRRKKMEEIPKFLQLQFLFVDVNDQLEVFVADQAAQNTASGNPLITPVRKIL
jgi:hypothetical protein